MVDIISALKDRDDKKAYEFSLELLALSKYKDSMIPLISADINKLIKIMEETK